MFISQGRRCVLRRFCYDLAPEKTTQVVLIEGVFWGTRNVSIRDVQVGIAVMIEVDEIGAPRPAPHGGTRLLACVLKLSIPLVAIKRITPRMLLVERANLFGGIGVEWLLF